MSKSPANTHSVAKAKASSTKRLSRSPFTGGSGVFSGVLSNGIVPPHSWRREDSDEPLVAATHVLVVRELSTRAAPTLSRPPCRYQALSTSDTRVRESSNE